MKAYEFLSEESRWCKAPKSCLCCTACNEKGRCVSLGSIAATKWTLFGAVSTCYQGQEFLAAFKKLQSVIGKDIFEWNNAAGRTYHEVITLLRELDI